MNETKQLLDLIVEGIQEKKGTGIVIADLTKVEGSICQYFVICQGNSPSQVEAITESVGDMARIKQGEKPTSVVGLNNAYWVAMDYTDIIVHIFIPEARAFYNLENLWEDAPQTVIPDID